MQLAGKAYRTHRPGKARILLKKALALEPNDPGLHAAMGELAYQQKDWTGSAEAFETAMAVASRNHLPVSPYVKPYANSLYQSGQREDALKKLQGLLKTELRNTDAAYLNYMIGTLYQELARSKVAMPFLEKAATLDPTSADIQFNLGLAYELTGHLDEARQHYRNAYQLNPVSKDVNQALARLKG